MKLPLFAFIIATCVVWSFGAKAQTCYRTASSFNAAPGGYAISGSGLLKSANDTLKLFLDSAFNTTSGPDLYVYLAINFDAPTVSGNTNIEVAPLGSTTGYHSYVVPAGVNINDYNYVLIHCKTFNHFWGGGLLATVNCVAGIQENLASSIKIYPNSSGGKISFENLPRQTGMSVFNLTERIVYSASEITDREQDLSFLNKGVYFIRLIHGDETATTKIVIN